MTSPQDPPPPAQQPGAAASAPEAAQLLAAIGSLTAQVQVLSDRVQKLETRGSPDEAPEAVASDFSDAGSPGNEDDLFVPHVPGNNPFPERPPTTPLQPMLYGVDRDPVYNKIIQQKGTALQHEYRTTGPALSYLFDASHYFEANVVEELRALREWMLEDAAAGPEASDAAEIRRARLAKVDDILSASFATRNTLVGAVSLLSQRFSYIKLVAKVSKEDQGLLQFVSRKIYGFGDGMVVPDTNVSGWCEEYITRKDQAFLAQAANIAARAAASAKEESPYKQPPGRGAQASGAAAPGGGGGRPKGRGH